MASTQPPAPDLQPAPPQAAGAVRLPRVAIQFCTQCKWMLRAAYFAQELLSTFGPALGEVALQPATGGVFKVTIEAATPGAADGSATAATTTHLLWDRKAEGGFPETKELKRRVRDVIEPGRDLGHVDRHHAQSKETETATIPEAPATLAQPTPAASIASPAVQPAIASSNQTAPVCEDCQ